MINKSGELRTLSAGRLHPEVRFHYKVEKRLWQCAVFFYRLIVTVESLSTNIWNAHSRLPFTGIWLRMVADPFFQTHYLPVTGTIQYRY